MDVEPIELDTLVPELEERYPQVIWTYDSYGKVLKGIANPTHRNVWAHDLWAALSIATDGIQLSEHSTEFNLLASLEYEGTTYSINVTEPMPYGHAAIRVAGTRDLARSRVTFSTQQDLSSGTSIPETVRLVHETMEIVKNKIAYLSETEE